MESDIEQQSVRFHNKAREKFFLLFNDFNRSIAALDRRRDENVFQHLQAKYTNELKSQLRIIASQLLNELSSSHARDRFNSVVQVCTEEYIREFLQKARSL